MTIDEIFVVLLFMDLLSIDGIIIDELFIDVLVTAVDAFKIMNANRTIKTKSTLESFENKFHPSSISLIGSNK